MASKVLGQGKTSYCIVPGVQTNSLADSSPCAPERWFPLLATTFLTATAEPKSFTKASTLQDTPGPLFLAELTRNLGVGRKVKGDWEEGERGLGGEKKLRRIWFMVRTNRKSLSKGCLRWEGAGGSHHLPVTPKRKVGSMCVSSLEAFLGSKW